VSLATSFDSQGSTKRVSLLVRISKSDSRVNPNSQLDKIGNQYV
jgi:hypothetical protein